MKPKVLVLALALAFMPVDSVTFQQVDTAWASSSQCGSLWHRIKAWMIQNYTMSRGIEWYQWLLGDGFYKTLMGLKPGQHWIDMGSGLGVAAYEYLLGTRGAGTFVSERASVTAVTLGISKAPTWTRYGWKVTEVIPFPRKWVNALKRKAGDRFKLLEGQYVEKMDARKLKSADLISDLFGPMSYTNNVAKVLQVYLKTLKASGQIHLYLGESGFGSTVNGPRGSMSLIKWLEAIPGINVKRIGYHGDGLVITLKPGEAVSIPGLRQVRSNNGAPPKRDFIETGETLTII